LLISHGLRVGGLGQDRKTSVRGGGFDFAKHRTVAALETRFDAPFAGLGGVELKDHPVQPLFRRTSAKTVPELSHCFDLLALRFDLVFEVCCGETWA
jgi:hypothetical protein